MGQGAQQPGNAAQQAGAAPAQSGNQQPAPGQQSASALTPDQEDQIRNALANNNAARVDQANFGLNVGASVPRNEKLEPLPSQVGTIDPRLTGDKYLIVKDDIVIVDPHSSRVVALIPESGATNSGSNGSQPNSSGGTSNSNR